MRISIAKFNERVVRHKMSFFFRSDSFFYRKLSRVETQVRQRSVGLLVRFRRVHFFGSVRVRSGTGGRHGAARFFTRHPVRSFYGSFIVQETVSGFAGALGGIPEIRARVAGRIAERGRAVRVYRQRQ